MFIMKDDILVKSQFIQAVRDGDDVIIWHSLFGNPKIVSEETMVLLDVFSNPCSISSIFNEYDLGKNGEEIIQDLVTNHYLIPKDFNERRFLAEHVKEREKSIIDGSLID